jgi:hypothetical protein
MHSDRVSSVVVRIVGVKTAVAIACVINEPAGLDDHHPVNVDLDGVEGARLSLATRT